MTDLTVACLWVRGEYPYTVEYVRRLLAMTRRFCARPFRFVCLTDQPDALPAGVEPIRITKLAGWALWSKLHVFNPALGLTGRLLFLDLDTLIVAPLDPIVDASTPFGLTEDGPIGIETDRHGRQIRRRFNSSVMVWQGGEQADLFTAWTPAVAARLSTDQDWIAERRPEATALPRAWFPRISRTQPPWPDGATVVLCKKPKNHVARERWPWFDAAWGGEAA